MKEHELKIRIYYEDTDAGGIVYHASYLKFAERARTEMLRDMGFEHAQMFKEEKKGFVVVSMKVDYRMPAVLDDLLTVKTSLLTLGGASMTLQQNVWRGDEMITEMSVTLVCIDKQFKAVRIPQQVRTIFEKEKK